MFIYTNIDIHIYKYNKTKTLIYLYIRNFIYGNILSLIHI